MKIAVISDSHDNLVNTQKALTYLARIGIDTIIHCGDICGIETLESMALEHKGDIHVVLGNNDSNDDIKKLSKKHKNIIFYGEFGDVVFETSRIAWCHYPQDAKSLGRKKCYEAVFYGHTHIPWEEMENGVKILNPGTLAGMFSKPTFAIYDTSEKSAQLILLEKI